jgi:hypothetical protein
MKKRFEFAGHTFRITKNFSYNMSYEAFCKGYVDPKELIGKEVLVPNEYDYGEKHTIVEVANKQMGLDFFGKHVTRTYITTIDSGQGRQLYYYWQRNFQGFDGSEIWNLDSKILEYLIPRLEYFSKYGGGQKWFTSFKDGEEVWEKGSKFVDEMVKGFKILKEKQYDTLTEYENQCINRAFNLFKSYFGSLWT